MEFVILICAITNPLAEEPGFKVVRGLSFFLPLIVHHKPLAAHYVCESLSI